MKKPDNRLTIDHFYRRAAREKEEANKKAGGEIMEDLEEFRKFMTDLFKTTRGYRGESDINQKPPRGGTGVYYPEMKRSHETQEEMMDLLANIAAGVEEIRRRVCGPGPYPGIILAVQDPSFSPGYIEEILKAHGSNVTRKQGDEWIRQGSGDNTHDEPEEKPGEPPGEVQQETLGETTEENLEDQGEPPGEVQGEDQGEDQGKKEEAKKSLL